MLMIVMIMVLILDGNSEIDAHVNSDLCYPICFRHLISSRANLIFVENTYFTANVRNILTCHLIYLTSNISTMSAPE